MNKYFKNKNVGSLEDGDKVELNLSAKSPVLYTS